MNNCLKKCPSLTFSQSNVTTGKPYCTSCSSNCLSCTSAIICLACISPYYLYSGSCIVLCPSSPALFPDLDSSCSPCQCLACSGYSYNCTLCSSPLSFYQWKCLSSCPTGTYSSLNSTQLVCQNCSSNCLKCSSASVCQLCSFSFPLYVLSSSNATCITTCPSGTILTIDSSLFSLQCEPCSNNCLTCSTSIAFCLSCQVGFTFQNNSCVASCSLGFYQINGSCLVCDPRCQYCLSSDPTNCSECIAGYYLYSYYCYSNCPIKTFAYASGKQCLNCNTHCSTCLNATNCTSCLTGYNIFQWNCYTGCPNFTTPVYYSYEGQCLACQTQCH